ncbi:hypothetical protein VL20_5311 [Microcystis panniformis FACHB-1757]|uniref:Uncharacterized protein n=1 Tax=Microcystis panniformis FACHB-1757 TaxID=1638788 RepID=A0A0K1S7R0_9CHRO|nr:hypothetical protein VL20_5311 [Microcystis panniformis FACHB-1757]
MPPLSRGIKGDRHPLIKGGLRGDRHPPYQGGIKGGSAPPLSRGAGGIEPKTLTAKKGVGKTKLPAAPCLFPDLPRSDTIKRLSWKN